MSIDFREERKGEREREPSMWERNIDRPPPIHAPTRDQTHNLGMYPDQESNLQPFGVQDDTSINWATQPGQILRNICANLIQLSEVSTGTMHFSEKPGRSLCYPFREAAYPHWSTDPSAERCSSLLGTTYLRPLLDTCYSISHPLYSGQNSLLIFMWHTLQALFFIFCY